MREACTLKHEGTNVNKLRTVETRFRIINDMKILKKGKPVSL